jgi:hypothetical protein
MALTVVGQASADHDDDDKRSRQRHASVVITADVGHVKTRPVRAPAEPLPPRYDWRYERYQRRPDPGLIEARRELHEQRKDHEQIVRIARRWEQTTAHRNPHAQYDVERRLVAWIDREIQESNRKADRGRYVHRLHALRRELRVSRGRYGHGRGYGHGRHRSNAHTASIIGELVALSEHELQRAENRARRHMHLAFAHR